MYLYKQQSKIVADFLKSLLALVARKMQKSATSLTGNWSIPKSSIAFSRKRHNSLSALAPLTFFEKCLSRFDVVIFGE